MASELIKIANIVNKNICADTREKWTAHYELHAVNDSNYSALLEAPRGDISTQISDFRTMNAIERYCRRSALS